MEQTLSNAWYVVNNNTNDGIHTPMYADLLYIWYQFVTWNWTWAEAITQANTYLDTFTGANFDFEFHEDGTLGIWCTNNANLVQFNPPECASNPPSNANLTTGSPSTQNQARVKNASSCWFTCKNTHFWDRCQTAYVCSGTKPGLHVNLMAWTPTATQKTRQNTNSWAPCYYTCTWGYTWSNCSTPPPADTPPLADTTPPPADTTPANSCTSRPSYSHASFTTGSPSSVNQSRVKNASSCWYTCTDGFSGSTCSNPPAPTVSSSTSPRSCNYISSRSETWTNCSVNGDWSSNGTIQCRQTSSRSANYSSSSRSCTTTTTTTWDGASSSSTSCTWGCPRSASRPSNRTANITIYASVTSPSSTCNGTQYANNLDSCNLRVNISGSTRQSRSITWLAWLWVSNFTDTSGLKTDRTNNTWDNALNFSWVSSTSIGWSWRSYYFDINNIKSKAPFIVSNGTLSFRMQGKSGAYTSMNLSNIGYNFKKPFSWDMTIDWDGIIGTEQQWQLLVYKNNCSGCGPHTISNFANSLQAGSSNYEVQDVNSEQWLTGNPTLKFTLNYIWNTQVWTATVQSRPHVTYNLWWSSIKYQLSESEWWNSVTPISSSSLSFIWVKVVGTLQWEGKWEFTGQEANFSQITKMEVRWDIRKNAILMTKWLSSWDVINWVKYVEWDMNLSWNGLWYETLVVKNGNITIDGDLNTLWEKLWIIVLQDNYDVKTPYAKKWNIYVNSDVKYIDAIMYADGWLISANSSGVPYTQDSLERWEELSNQLVLKGTLFTRNTIGWSIWSTSNASLYYILPSWETTTDFDNAMIYDLNYIRRWSDMQDATKNAWHNDPFVIIYNPEIQTNPPKGFWE